MIVRNRLLALLYRIGGLALAISAIIFWGRNTSSIGIHALCYVPTLLSIYSSIIFSLLIIVTAIDLRKGFWGIASGLYMPLGMSLTFFSFLQLVLHLGYSLPTGGAFFSTGEVLSCVLLPIISIGEWLLFEEKGTIGFSILPAWYLFPSLYLMLVISRPSLWSNAPLLNGTPYPYSFMNFDLFPIWQVFVHIGVATILIAGLGVGLIFLNNFLAGKYRKQRINL